MPREHIHELRGDSQPDAMDIYYHIDLEDLRKSYLAHIPRLGVNWEGPRTSYQKGVAEDPVGCLYWQLQE